jgi:DNA-binding FadR family transcriptional regulator
MLSLLPGRPAISLPQHERIIAAIRDRDPAQADAAMREHIASVTEALREMGRLGNLP